MGTVRQVGQRGREADPEGLPGSKSTEREEEATDFQGRKTNGEGGQELAGVGRREAAGKGTGTRAGETGGGQSGPPPGALWGRPLRSLPGLLAQGSLWGEVQIHDFHGFCRKTSPSLSLSLSVISFLLWSSE